MKDQYRDFQIVKTKTKTQPSKTVFDVLKAAKTMHSTGKSKADIQNFACCEPCMWETYVTMSYVQEWTTQLQKEFNASLKCFQSENNFLKC